MRARFSAARSGENHWRWKGDAVRYESVDWANPPPAILYDGKVYRRNPEAEQRAHRVYYWRHDGNHKSPVSLHRQLWIDNFGPIDRFTHVHHKDGNPLNNRISNLASKDGAKHISDHMRRRTPQQIREARRNMLYNVIPAAAAWHKSESGRKWHREHPQGFVRKARLQPPR
jgi:hypothetical protein